MSNVQVAEVAQRGVCAEPNLHGYYLMMDVLPGAEHEVRLALMHFPELEWHVFGYEAGGFLDALCIYGQVTNIRPEEILQK